MHYYIDFFSLLIPLFQYRNLVFLTQHSCVAVGRHSTFGRLLKPAQTFVKMIVFSILMTVLSFGKWIVFMTTKVHERFYVT